MRSISIVVMLVVLTVTAGCTLRDVFTLKNRNTAGENAPADNTVTVLHLDTTLSEKWAVQVGAFTNVHNAVEHGVAFVEAGYQTYVLKGYVDDKEFDRVQIGPYDTEAEAMVIRDEVLERGVHDEAFVVQLEAVE